MASFGKLTNAFLQASQETTLALANLNFDFTLIKYDAPQEYRGLGEALSTRRKAAAEDGSYHITARKLGALFQSALPDCPRLIRAYGIRASEIGKLPDVNPRGTARQGVFADHVGADGTSIWAAATSGREAIAMHLLACMLARIWKREEAVPIWAELVEQRKTRLQEAIWACDSSFNISDLTASRIDIGRSQLDEWDASARAWLQTADEARKLQQTQLRLLIDNISLPVSTHRDVYAAIMDAWTTALKALDSLIQGSPQRIDNGAILLGLASWHLYPDILLAGTNQLVRQNDPLIETGAVITIGLQSRGDDAKGVFWSLPLSQARYYGDPVLVTGAAGVMESRVSFEEFMYVVLGSVIGSWKAPDVPLEAQLDLLRTVAKVSGVELPDSPLTLGFKEDEAHDLHWLARLDRAAGQYSRSSGMQRQQISRLISLGQRRWSSFLPPRPNALGPVFGMTRLSAALAAFEDNTSRLHFLRNFALRELGAELASHAVIRLVRDGDIVYIRVAADVRSDEPMRKKQKMGEATDGHGPESTSQRWSGEPVLLYMKACLTKDGGMMLYTEDTPREPYLPILGDLGRPAILAPARLSDKMKARLGGVEKNYVTVAQLLRCVKAGDMDDHILESMLRAGIRMLSQLNLTSSLRALETAAKIYAHLPGAKVDLRVTSKAAGLSWWWLELSDRKHRKPTLNIILSCVAYFETGGHDVVGDRLENRTFAMCYGNSIYVASKALSDPLAPDPLVPLQRIIGNIGKPGLAFLTTPSPLMVRRLDAASWHMVAHEQFDGTPQDNFHGTSLHASFSGYELPLELGRRGARDMPACVMETAVSVYDKGEWVGDVDLLDDTRELILLNDVECEHSAEEKKELPPSAQLVTVDSWAELLDPPVQDAILRAHRNPTARLAAAALAARLYRNVVVVPEHMCWRCRWENVVSAAAAQDSPAMSLVGDNDDLHDLDTEPLDLDAESLDLDAESLDLDAESRDLDAKSLDLDAESRDLDAEARVSDAEVDDLDAEFDADLPLSDYHDSEAVEDTDGSSTEDEEETGPASSDRTLYIY